MNEMEKIDCYYGKICIFLLKILFRVLKVKYQIKYVFRFVIYAH